MIYNNNNDNNNNNNYNNNNNNDDNNNNNNFICSRIKEKIFKNIYNVQIHPLIFFLLD